MGTQQTGWYPDPSGNATRLRYWDGMQWTNDFADAQPTACPEGGYRAPAYGQPVVAPVYYPSATTESDRTLRLIAFIFCLISTISVGWAIIPLAWMIPMSVHCWGVYQGTKPNTVAFGVCTLIFVTVVGGILLLVSKKER